jgi:HK97 family phage major capsid protein
MKDKYLAKRKALMNAAQDLLNEGKMDEANAKLKEVESLDSEFENAAKAQANINAMKDKALVTNIADKSVNVLDGTTVDNVKSGAEAKNEAEVYKNAFAKTMMGKPLDKNESETFNRINDDFRNVTQTAETHTVVIPETVKAGIWKEIGEAHPIFGDLTPTFVAGDLTIIQDTDPDGDAEWVDEDTKSEDGEVGFATVNLTGCELMKTITVSWKLKKMSVDAFLDHVTTKIAEKMGNALAKGMISGKGKPGESDQHKPQPKGIVTALEAEASTPQVVEYESAITYKNMTDVMSKIKSGYAKGGAIYATNTTIWGELANIVDGNNKPMFIPDVTLGGVGRIFGLVVKEEDGMNDGEVLFGNVAKGYAVNINENMTMYNEDHIKARTTDYMGYALVDGDVLTTKAFALLKKKSV